MPSFVQGNANSNEITGMRSAAGEEVFLVDVHLEGKAK
jgi:hypothetical protein